MTKVPDIPSLPANTPAELKRVLEPLREYVQTIAGRRGDELDTAVTFRDLVDSGIASLDVSKSARFGAPSISLNSPEELADYSTPPAPTSLTTTSGIAAVYLGWGGAAFASYSHTEIWRSATNDLATAVMIATSVATRYADDVSVSGTYYYWVRFVSKTNVKGPYNLATGSSGYASQDPTYLIEVLRQSYGTAEIDGKPFFYVPTATTINGVSVPVGTYIKTAYIADASISSAKIGSLVANKITAGFINADVGVRTLRGYNTNLYAGGTYTDQLDSNGNVVGVTVSNPTFQVVNGVADFNVDAFRIFNTGSGVAPFEVVSGAVRIKTAYIGNATITSAKIADSIQSDDYSAGFAGWKINKSGSAEFYNVTVRGSLNADDITAGTLSAARIASGSISAGQIDTRGLTIKDSGGNVIFSSGSSATSANQVTNSDFFQSINYWDVPLVQDGGTEYTLSRNGAGDAWRPLGGNTISLQRLGNAKTGLIGFRNNQKIPVVANLRYEFSAYLASHRCDIYLSVSFFNSSGTQIGSADTSTGTRKSGGPNLTDWRRAYGFATAPSGASYAMVYTYVTAVDAGQYDGWGYGTQYYVGLASASQTEPSPWSPGPLGFYGSLDADRTTWDNGLANSGRMQARTYISDLSVDTLQVAGEAITVPRSVEGAFTVISGIYGAGPTISLPVTPGSKVIIIGFWYGGQPAPTGSSSWRRTVINDGVHNEASAQRIQSGTTVTSSVDGDIVTYQYSYAPFIYVGTWTVPSNYNSSTANIRLDAPYDVPYSTLVCMTSKR